MSYTRKYANLAEREAHIVEAEVNGLTMLHDDYDPDWLPGQEPYGTLTFTEPTPKSDEELYFEQLERENNDVHPLLLQAYRNFDDLTAAQIKAVIQALLRDYLVRQKEWYLSVL